MQILVVEDDLDFQKSLLDLLEKVGYGVEAVGDGLSALERMEHADVLLADLGVPGMDGLELCTEARTRWPSMNVIIMTGCDTPLARREAALRGAEAYLAKPFDREVLLAYLRRFEGTSNKPAHVGLRRVQVVEGR